MILANNAPLSWLQNVINYKKYKYKNINKNLYTNTVVPYR